MPTVKNYGALMGPPPSDEVKNYGSLMGPPPSDGVKNYGALMGPPPKEGLGTKALKVLTAVAPLFEPFQLLQQYAFAKTSDYIETAKTGKRSSAQMDRFRRERWSYFPYGAQPEMLRFGDLLRSAGVKNDQVLRWGGLVGDLVADPLVFGSWVSVVGKVSKAPALAKAGQAINYWTSPTGLAKIAGESTDALIGKPGFSTEIATGLLRKIFEGEKTAELSRFFLGRNTMLGAYGELGQDIERNFRVSDTLGEQVMNFTLRQFNDINQTLKTAAGGKKHVLDLLSARTQRFVDERVLQKGDAIKFITKATDLAGQPNWAGFGQISEEAVSAAKTLKTYKKEITILKDVAKANGLDPEAMARAFKDTVGKLTATHVELGYRLSRFPRFKEAVDVAAQQFGLNPDSALNKVFSQALTATEKASAPVSKITGKPPVPNPFITAVDAAWKEMEPGMASLSVNDYISGLANGYMRRVIGSHTNLKTVLGSIRSGRVVPYKEFRPASFIKAASERYGSEAADKMSKYIGLWPGKSINMENLYSVARQAGVKEDFKQFVRNMTPAVSPDLGYIEETITALERAYDKQQQAVRFRGGLVNKDVFAERQQLSETALAELGRIESATGSLAGSGAITGKVLKSQEYMAMSYQMLKDNKLMLTPDELKLLPSAEKAAFAYLDEGASMWGPMAGHYVPKMFVNETKAAAARYNPEGLARVYQDFLRTIRGLLLGNPPTVVKNVAGTFLMLHAKGVDVPAVAKEFTPAINDLIKFGKTGDLPADVAPYAHLMPFLLEGSLTAELKQGLEAALIGKAAQANTFDGFMTKLREGVEAMNRSPLGKATMPLRPAGQLAAFSLTERAAKLAVARHTAKTLQEGGMEAEKAWDAAAHLGTHVIFDYANTSGLVETLKRTGLALFPAYSWFSMGRFASVAAKNPAALAVQSRIAPAWNEAVVDDEEAARLDAVMAGWMRSQSPLTIPLPAEDGNYFLAPLSGFMPFSTVQGAQLVEGAMGTLSGGVLRPFIEASVALSRGDGRAVFSEKYGQRVFNPEDTPQQKMLASLLFVAQGYLPAMARSIYGPALSPFVGLNPSGSDPGHYFELIANPDYLAALVRGRSSKDINATLPQLLMRAGGLSSYRTSVIEGQFTGLQAQIGVISELEAQKQSIRAQMAALERKMMATDNEDRRASYQQQIEALNRKFEALAQQAQARYDNIAQALRPQR